MEENQKQHITKHLWKLILLTQCNISCTSILIQNNVLSVEDKAELDSISNEIRKTSKLYDLLLIKKGSYSHLITALEEGHQTGALHILNQLGNENDESDDTFLKPSEEAPPPKRIKRDKISIKFGVKPPVHYFVGRETEIFDLHQKLQESERNQVVILQRPGLAGIGGIGKTELARKYVEVNGENFYDGNVIWINAETEATLEESFRRLASNYLNISLTDVHDEEIEIETIVNQIYSHFSHEKVIFIFDNAESMDYLQPFMPSRVSSSSALPHILITSRYRNKEWSFNGDVLELQEMTDEEAICFVKCNLQIENGDDDDVQVLKLAHKLQRFPLALSQAVAYIKRMKKIRCYSISKYLEEYEANEKKLYSLKFPFATKTYMDTTFTTWKLTTQTITNEENGQYAMEILNIISYFHPDKIPISIFEYLSDGGEYQSALQLLAKYSMINIQQEEKTISVHRLVQEVTKMLLKSNNQEEPALKTALYLVSSDLSGKSSVQHAISAFKFCCDLNPELAIEFKGLPWKIVEFLSENVRYADTKEVGNELEELLSKLVQPDDPDLVRLKIRLANAAYAQQEDYEPGVDGLEKLLKQIEENMDKTFSEEETLSVERNLASCLRNLDRYQEALELFRKIFKRYNTLYGLNNWQTIKSLVEVATCIWKLEPSDMSEEDFKLLQSSSNAEFSFSSAISVLKDAHQINLELVGKDLNWTDTMFCVADWLEDICERESATKILTDVIERTTNSCDDKGFLRVLIDCLNLLGFIKMKEKKNEDALVIYQNVHSKLLAWKGSEDPEILQAKEMFEECLMLTT